tara:strand:+ start:107 stop:472 length:366 start_codon:yes stop_codon:yes gene_type:complete
MMAIQPKEYNDLKEYWDYQRKIAYNKEQIYAMAERFEGRTYNDFGPVHIDEVKKMLWDKIKPEEYEEPPEDWVPQDPKLRMWHEDQLDTTKISPKARKVVLRANPIRQKEMPNILNDDNNF